MATWSAVVSSSVVAVVSGASVVVIPYNENEWM
jgi:hypothetical protein